MIIQLKSKETGEDIKDGLIEIEDEIILQCFAIASELNMPFSDWFNGVLANYIEEHKDDKDIVEDAINMYLNCVSDETRDFNDEEMLELIEVMFNAIQYLQKLKYRGE